VAERLAVWLYGTAVAYLQQGDNYRLTLDWAEEGIARWGRGSRVLSVSLPLGAPLDTKGTAGLDFFENLLPEGPTKIAMARLAGVTPSNTYGILESFGGDCAGAVVVLPDGEAQAAPRNAGYNALTEEDLATAVRMLESAPLGSDIASGYKPSLSGYQRKLLVGRDGNGVWQRPEGGSPSTWILKPDGRTPMASNEITCLNLAEACGLEVPDRELLIVDGAPTLAIRRYDRAITDEGVIRLHQEDACQATSIPPDLKYESDGGPSLLAVATVIRDFGVLPDLRGLLRRVAFNSAIGNADAHAKNTSFLHLSDAVAVQLAPVYDLVSTMALEPVDDQGRPIANDPRMGQMVNGVLDSRNVTDDDLIAEGASWRLRRDEARQIVDTMLDRAAEAVRRVEGDERVLAAISERIAQLRT
jgi:serine/threonine-protein kinase HipA